MYEIKAHISINQRNRALQCLKHRHHLEEILEKRLRTTQTLEKIWIGIHEAESDADALKAYETGAQTIKSLLSENGLTPEAVDEAANKLADTLADQAEIQDALTTVDPVGIDEEELEQELEDLINEERKKDDHEEEDVKQATDALENLQVVDGEVPDAVPVQQQQPMEA